MSDSNTRQDGPELRGFWGLLGRRPWQFGLVFFIAGGIIVKLAALPFQKTSNSPYAPGLDALEINLLAYMLPLTVLAVILTIAELRDSSPSRIDQRKE